MTEFSELFSKWVNEKEIKVSALAQFCGLDRPTVYKYLNGQRLPATKELAERIGEFLRLSPAQRQEFLEIYQITKMGKSTYQNRKRVREFLLGDWNEQKDDAKAPRNAGQNPALDAKTAAVSGEEELEEALGTLLLEESRKERPLALLIYQPQFEFLRRFFTARAALFANTRVEHIICMNNEETHGGESEENLNNLSQILPMYAHQLDYHPYYYYDKTDSHFYNLNLLPCMAAASDAVLLFHPEEKRGILIRDRQAVAMMKKQFYENKFYCQPLLQKGGAQNLADACKRRGEGDGTMALIQSGPVIPFPIPDGTDGIGMYFTEDGLRRFMEMGVSTKDGYSRQDCLRILKEMTASDRVRPILLRESYNGMNPVMHVWISMDFADFVLMDSQQEPIHLFLKERALVQLFYEFAESLDETQCFTWEESRNRLEQIGLEYEKRYRRLRNS